MLESPEAFTGTVNVIARFRNIHSSRSAAYDPPQRRKFLTVKANSSFLLPVPLGVSSSPT